MTLQNSAAQSPSTIDFGHRAKAEEVAASLWRHERPLAILLVGSVAEGRATPDSDIDLVVLKPGLPAMTMTTRLDGGFRVSVEEYPAERFWWSDTKPRLSMAQLREAGRLARGALLYSAWPDYESASAGWRNAVLDQDECISLLVTASESLDAVHNDDETSFERLWWLQGSFSAAAMLSLSLAPCRFQKPKWVARDLAVHDSVLSDLLPVTFRTPVENGLVSETEWLRNHFDDACRARGFPGTDTVTFAVDETDWHLAYGYRTLLDARSLGAAGDVPGCQYTLFAAARLLLAILVERSGSAAWPESATVWRDDMLQRLAAVDMAQLDRTAAALGEHIDRLTNTYAALYQDGEIDAATDASASTAP